MFQIISESAISAGVRRIEAITGQKVEEYLENATSTLKQLKSLLNNPSDIPQAIQDLHDKNSALSKQIEEVERKEAMKIKDSLKRKAQLINGITIISETLTLENAALIKDICFQLRNEIPNLFMVVGASIAGKANLSIIISDNLVAERKLHAGNIVREAAKAIQGGGGGQPFYASAGGNNPEGLKQAYEIALSSIK